MSITFKPLAEQHAPEVMVIFNYYIEHGFAAYPETPLPEQFFGKFLEMTKGYPAFVIKDDEAQAVVGFCFLRAYSPFPAFKKTAEISYFIKPEYTGKGLGTRALKTLEYEAKKQGIRFLLAGIASKNEPSLSFHRKHDFAECGQFREIGVKKGVTFNVIWMQKQLG